MTFLVCLTCDLTALLVQSLISFIYILTICICLPPTQEDNSDCRSRASRVFKEQCPPPLLQCFSFSHPQPLPQLAPARTANMTDNGAVSLTTVRKVVSQSDTDHEGVVDLVRLSMQLAPQRRLPVDLLLQFALFRQPVSALTASLSACNSVRYCFVHFHRACISPKSRFDKPCCTEF